MDEVKGKSKKRILNGVTEQPENKGCGPSLSMGPKNHGGIVR